MKLLPTWLWASLAAIFLLKLALVAGLPVHVVFSPHDDSLYLIRALFLLNDGWLGTYDARVLAKLPGISIWLAGLRSLGLPYLLTMNVLYAAAGLYVLLGLRRCGVHAVVLLAIWVLYLLNPVSMSLDWVRILRESLSTTLLVALFGAALHILVRIREGARYWPHLLLLSVILAFSMVVREEDKLLWGMLLLLAAAAALDGILQGRRLSVCLGVVAPLLIAPVLTVMVCDYSLRQAVESRYGLPILHDYGEGEYPKMLAAIRSIDTQKDNRLVMVTQEALTLLRAEVPAFAPVIDLLPPPGPATFSCRLQGVCTEWSNGWMPFWIKDAAFSAGLTPDLVTAQKYFKGVREQIEEACRSGRLKCTSRGSGILPPFELRWTRAFVAELRHLLGMLLIPLPDGLGGPGTDRNTYPELRRIAQTITMDVIDTKVQLGSKPESAPLFGDAFVGWRTAMLTPQLIIAAVVLVLSLPALLYCWTAPAGQAPSVLLWIVTVFFVYSAARLLALTYISTFFGPFDPRIIFSTYTAALIFCPAVIAEAVRQYFLALHQRRAHQPES
jgi:hypothetical protein